MTTSKIGFVEDAFDLHDKVASSVAGVLEPALRAAETAYSVGCPTRDLTAYDRYLQFCEEVSAERPVPADEKSGLHFCFAAPNTDAVDAFHAVALRCGGQDNGAPGPRPEYYAAFIIDPDGYRLEAYCGQAKSEGDSGAEPSRDPNLRAALARPRLRDKAAAG